MMLMMMIVPSCLWRNCICVIYTDVIVMEAQKWMLYNWLQVNWTKVQHI